MAIQHKPKPIKKSLKGLDKNSLKHAIATHLEYSVGKDVFTATNRDWFTVSALVARDRMVERWMQTMRTYYEHDAKRVYYLSLEFLIGRTLINSLLNIGFLKEFNDALMDAGLNLTVICDQEPDAALGNGGLGRLAACFLDSMATLGIPGYGYGIRYEYGMFTQRIENGVQVEHPENWLRYGNPWEFPRPEVLYPVKFYGRVMDYIDDYGQRRSHWIDTEEVMAMAYDTPIPGYRTHTVNNMRLWAAKATRDFDLGYFNEGNYIKAVEEKNESEDISKVLYPDDTTEMGRELRLKQQYFFVSASLQDILFRYKKHHDSFDQFPDKIAIQLNDTHPVLAIPELMRILVDNYNLNWDYAWDITTRTFSYTNHTLLPEALETWPVALMEKMLPRHLQIIYEINHHFLKSVMHRHPGNMDLVRRVSIIDEDNGRRVRMAHLAVIGTHKVNGVAALHTQLMKSTIFSDFAMLYPDKIVNMTNGVTPRRWLHHCNPLLAELISGKIGEKWTTDLEQLRALVPYAEDIDFRRAFGEVKRINKLRLSELIKERVRVEVNLDSLFDVQVKRIHEYKRQLLNVLHVITLYNRIRANPHADIQPRTKIFAGKAAPAYVQAKLIIELINCVADVVNNDPVVGDKLKVVFIPNYNVSVAEEIIPACELSEQISMAGTEASGTSNMKFALNGALTIGTLDGANIEIREEVGADNFFIFGMTAEQIQELKLSGYQPWKYYHENPELKQALDMIGDGYFSPLNRDRFQPIFQSLLHHGDHYALLADYQSYINCQEEVTKLYDHQAEWNRKAILNVAHMGKFSSDRTINEYARHIWHATAVPIRLPEEEPSENHA